MKLKFSATLLFLICTLSSCGILTRLGEKNMAKKLEVKEEKPVEFYITEGIKNISLYDNQEAAQALFNQAIKVDSLSAAAYYYAAENLIETDQKTALKYARRATRLDSENLWFKDQFGRLLLMNQLYSEALGLYQELVKLVPQDANYYRLLAAIYHQENQSLEAIKVLNSAEEKFGRIEELSSFKRQLLIQTNQISKAIEESITLAQEYPFNTENLLLLAELYAATEQNLSALEYYNKVLEINPLHAETLISLHQFYKVNKDSKNQVKTLQRIFLNKNINLAIKLKMMEEYTSNKQFYKNNYATIGNLINSLLIANPKEYLAVELKAEHLIFGRRLEEALDFYKSNLGDSTSHFSIVNNIISLESYLQRADSVEKYTNLALVDGSKDANVYIAMGASLTYLKKADQAVKVYAKAIEYAESDSVKSVIYGMMGDAVYNKKDKSEAEKYYKLSIKLDENNALVLNNYAYFLVTEKDQKKGFKTALQLAEKANKLEENSPTFLDTWAWALYTLGNYAEAKTIMQRALFLDNNRSMELLLHYGDILYALGDYITATMYWQKALEKGAEGKEIEKRINKIQKK
ncbi:MAG: tetratricopeptide repeat protein [Rikenellaceae bacterium]